MISKGHPKLSIANQCELLTVSRSGLYKPAQGESKLNLELMVHMDKHYLIHPYKGVPRMHVNVTKDLGYKSTLSVPNVYITTHLQNHLGGGFLKH